ncbi:MAG: phospholipase D-like domain-containing protein [Pseudobdellovibrionaceae bacterium]
MMKKITTEKLFFSGDLFYSDILFQISQAQTQILFEFYIFSADEIGGQFEAALKTAAERGVEIFMIVDGLGSMDWVSQRLSILDHPLIHIKVFHPVSTRRFYNGVLFYRLGSFFKKMELFFSMLNRRDHRKVVVIDQQHAWLGSYNIDRCHSETLSGSKAWIDIAVKVTGPRANQVAQTFFLIWNQSNQFKVSFLRNFLKFSTQQNLASSLKEKISNANHKIWITSPYIAPTKNLMNALLNAARRGVDVRIFLSQGSDVFFMPWVAKAHYRRFLNAGIRIFEVQNQFIHAKCVLFDENATVGSSNLNARSLIQDLEIDIEIVDDNNKQLLQAKFEQFQNQSVEVKTFSMNPLYIIGSIILFFFGRFI